MSSTLSSSENNSMAVASIISAAVTWLVGGLGSCVLTFVFPPVAICTGLIFLGGSVVAVITGHMARRQIKESGGMETGEGMATTGLVLGWIGVAANLMLVCLVLVGVFGLTLMGPQIGNVFSDIVRELATPQP